MLTWLHRTWISLQTILTAHSPKLQQNHEKKKVICRASPSTDFFHWLSPQPSPLAIRGSDSQHKLSHHGSYTHISLLPKNVKGNDEFSFNESPKMTLIVASLNYPPTYAPSVKNLNLSTSTDQQLTGQILQNLVKHSSRFVQLRSLLCEVTFKLFRRLPPEENILLSVRFPSESMGLFFYLVWNHVLTSTCTHLACF